MLRKLVPDIVNMSVLISVAPEATARDVAVAMTTHRVAAVLVMDGKRLVGIVTERDITGRIVAEGRNPAVVRADEIMTRDPYSLPPDATAFEALGLMQAHKFRHLPIVEDDRVVAMVSMRDLHSAIHRQLSQDLRDRDTYIHGENYGVA
ncbi:CBS domain-containing protein [Roseospira marina]|uniref:CBS domain-containing protein n=1 Tax=Roseospira marina TaxID=140057 RepID=A0A5M6IBN0_9PROT|nr:CBS domain-containing protein [Roseospira marina]KAA5605653.1 CBS domain-containing protein [Roseospira marina]MBB4313271.1 CBS domain-containing protein [Roseospira marina]MBB5085988.1 CBS domain-containing protein [Roseospira marina]